MTETICYDCTPWSRNNAHVPGQACPTHRAALNAREIADNAAYERGRSVLRAAIASGRADNGASLFGVLRGTVGVSPDVEREIRAAVYS